MHCAGQLPPSGGSPDSIPPEIAGTVPDTNAIHVEENRIQLEFSEYVDRRSVEESIFISPHVGDLEFDWNGTEVTVEFSEALRKNTTYVVNVGTDVVDIRANNRMAEGFTLAFSTGDSIDRGYISGRVFDEEPEGVMIFAYALDGADPDTLDPSALKPDYIMQTGKGGKFALSNIALGTYRLFAIRDEFRNLIYDREIDQYGVTHADVTVDAQRERVSDIWFRLSQEDTSKPFLTRVDALDRYQLQVRFSEAIDSLTFERAAFHLSDTLTQKPIVIALSYLNRQTPMLAGLITATPLHSGLSYRLRADKIYDRAGNLIDSMNASYVFTGRGVPDTLRPTVSISSLADGQTGYPLERSLEITFSEPVDQEPLKEAIILVDSVEKHVETEMRWLNATDVALFPEQPLMSKACYEVRIILDSLRDRWGNGYTDSTFVLRFETLDLRTTGVIEGAVVDEPQHKGKGPVYISASSIDVKPKWEKTVRLESPGAFMMEQLVEGRYVIKGFRDADGSGSYS